MGLSRLENFIKNVRGNILYVSPNDLDSTDSVDNKGNSLTRPFKSIQRALVEASRFSYQRGLNNDRFNQTTILVYPGDYDIDNRPGWIPEGLGTFRLRNGLSSDDFTAWDSTTVYNLDAENNSLYKINSVYGGVIVPRGVSIIGIDLRKTRIRPKYIPSPTDSNISRSAIFRLTGGSYVSNFTVLDADPNKTCYLDYTETLYSPNFSHHKLTCFEYVDGTNGVSIKDNNLTYESTRTDLDMYYEKIGLVYGTASGREIQPDYPSTGIDIQAKVDEYRIVGPTGQSVGISSIKAGDGLVTSSTITVDTDSAIDGLDTDNVIVIKGISDNVYNGRYVVSNKISPTRFTYILANPPLNPLPGVTASTASIVTDNITSASPYVNTITMKSVYGMCGLFADGSKSSGFKSIVVSQFSGISLQKDENAFVKFNTVDGVYEDTAIPGNENLSSDGDATYKPAYSNFHIKGSNDSYIQAVSCFAIGFSDQFVSENGSNLSLSNCNSNFGSKSLSSVGFRNTASQTDDLGYITHIIPPKEIDAVERLIPFSLIDIETTKNQSNAERLYLYDQKNRDAIPENTTETYSVGAKESDRLFVLTSAGSEEVEYSSRIVMANSQVSSEKLFNVNRSSAGINSISSSTITFTEDHTFENGESVRIISEDGSLPDGLFSDQLYFAITTGLNSDEIKLAKTRTDANENSALTFNNFGGSLNVVSRVSDKRSGDTGHPIQYDSSVGQWYVKVAFGSSLTDNQIYNNLIVGLGTAEYGNVSPRTYIKRTPDFRTDDDLLYKFRYVIPSSSSTNARPPSIGAIIQESNTSIASTSTEIQKYFGSGSITDINQIRNFKIVSHARWDSSTSEAHLLSELPHKLSIGSQVELINVKSTVNSTGIGNSGFNGTFNVTGISSAREFTVGLTTDPGVFSNDTTVRDVTLPYYKRKRYESTYYVQNVNEVQEYVNGEQDGIYHLTVLNSSNSPSLAPFTDDAFSQSIRNLYPKVDYDNPKSNPNPAISVAVASPIGKVVVDEDKNSITRETAEKILLDTGSGIGITDIVSSVDGTTHEIHTLHDHGLNGVTRVSIASSGSDYHTTGTETIRYDAKLVGAASSSGPTGKDASAKITVDAEGGGITSILIMSGGSGYHVGNVCNVVSIGSSSTVVLAEVIVEEINNNVGDTVRISGVTSSTYQSYNDVYRISEVGIGSDRKFVVKSNSAITGVVTTGIGSLPLSNASVYNIGRSVGINSINYTSSTGIATVSTLSNHGFVLNNKVQINTGISTMPEFGGEFIVRENLNLTSFTINLGVGATTEPVSTGTSMFALPTGWTSNAGDIDEDSQILTGRASVCYAGITTTLSSGIANATTDQISLTDVNTLSLTIGDYLLIDNEIVRIKTNVSDPPVNPISVFRAVFGTKATTHTSGSIVRKINPIPVEFRTPSRNVAQSHVWEHVGFGPGNYSTGLPDKQSRGKTFDEKILSQSIKRDGGLNFFDGIDNEGSSYFGNKKVNNVSGEETVFDGPITREGRSISKTPAVFEDKITSTSDDGIEVKNLLIKGDANLPRKYSVGIATPTQESVPGDQIYSNSPLQGQNAGWIYTNDRDWKRIGAISLSRDTDSYIFSNVGIGTTTMDLGDHIFQVGSGSSIFSIKDSGFVGVGTTAGTYRLKVEGESYFANNVSFGATIYASNFSGDGSQLTNLNVSATGWTQVEAGLGTGIYNSSQSRVGVGNTTPHFNLDVGGVGVGVTELRVRNGSRFDGFLNATHVNVSGILTSNNYVLSGSSSKINAGIVTTSTLVVGTAGTTITTTADDRIGIGTVDPRTKLDVEGRLRTKSHSENIEVVSVSAGNVNIDLNKASIFDLDLSTSSVDVTQFTLFGTPDSKASSEFIIRVKSNGSNSVGINTFKNQSGNSLRVYWPSSVPNVSISTDKYDFYRFRTFSRSGAIDIFGFIDGQNMGYQY